jgi:hypothetical protein
MLRRIDVVDPAAQHGDGADGQDAFVRGRVDAAGQAGDDHMAALAELRGDPAREPLAGGRGDPRADDRHAGAIQQLHPSTRPDQRRRRIERGQRLGEGGLA